jgi:hypothetical protein
MAKQDSKRSRGWLSSLFSISAEHRLRENLWARQQAEQKRQFRQLQERRSAVQWAEREGRLEREQQDKRETENERQLASIRTNNKTNQKLSGSERERSRRANFRCSTCTAENIDVPVYARRANNGLCCARGVDEYEGKFGVHGMPAEIFLEAPTANNQPAGPSSKACRCYNSGMTSFEVRDVATTASKRRAARDSMLDPELVREFINLPGSHIQYLPRPTSQPQRYRFEKRISRIADTPVHDPTGINWRLWSHSKQTAHGRYPPSPPPPDISLPHPPLRSTKGLKFHDSRQLIPHDHPTGTHVTANGRPAVHPRSPSPTLSVDSRSSRHFSRSIDPVSPLIESSFQEQPSRKLRSVASNIDSALNEALNAWLPVGGTGGAIRRKPLPRPHFTKTGPQSNLPSRRRR